MPPSQPQERQRRGLISPAEIIIEQEAQEAQIRAAVARAQARAQRQDTQQRQAEA